MVISTLKFVLSTIIFDIISWWQTKIILGVKSRTCFVKDNRWFVRVISISPIYLVPVVFERVRHTVAIVWRRKWPHRIPIASHSHAVRARVLKQVLILKHNNSKTYQTAKRRIWPKVCCVWRDLLRFIITAYKINSLPMRVSEKLFEVAANCFSSSKKHG